MGEGIYAIDSLRKSLVHEVLIIGRRFTQGGHFPIQVKADQIVMSFPLHVGPQSVWDAGSQNLGIARIGLIL